MSEDQRKILDMLSEGKISVDEAEKLLEALRYDKKRVEGTPRWVVLRDIGQAEWGVSVGLETVQTLLEEVRSKS